MSKHVHLNMTRKQAEGVRRAVSLAIANWDDFSELFRGEKVKFSAHDFDVIRDNLEAAMALPENADEHG